MIAVEQSVVGLILKKQDVPSSVMDSWHFGTDSDPRILTSYNWIMDPDPDVAPYPNPALFVSGFEDVNKK